MTKIVFITDSANSSGFGGDVLYSTQILEQLNGFDVKTIKLSPPSKLNAVYLFLFPFFLFFPLMWRGLFKNLISFFHQIKIEGEDRETIYFVDHFRNAWVCLLLFFSGRRRIVLVNHNIESQIYKDAYTTNKSIKRYIFLFEYIKLSIIERIVNSQVSHSTFITREDQVLSRVDIKMSTVISPCLAVDLHESMPHVLPKYDVLVIGSFYWNIKRENLLKALSELSKMPEINVCVAGSMPNEFRNELKRTCSDVEIFGEFDKLSELAGLGKVALAPDSLGGGFKLKILDYLNLGLVTFGLKGAMNGFDSDELAKVVYQFDSYSDLANGINEYLLGSQHKEAKFVRSLIRSQFSPEQLASKLVLIVESITNEKG